MADINLYQNKNQVFTWNWRGGDFELTPSLKPALYMSIFCRKRSEESLVKNPFFREGDPVNEFYQNYEVGSLFWFYSRQANTQQNAQAMENAITDGLQWLIDDNLVSEITVSTSREVHKLIINIQLTNTQTGIRENYEFSKVI